MKAETMDQAYLELLLELYCVYRGGLDEVNSRTGTGIRMLAGGHSFKLDLSSGRLPVPGNRRYWPRVAAAETAWQFMGTKSPEWIMRKAPKLWGRFIEAGELRTAYGYRWRQHFGRDQIRLAVEELRSNPTNRQLYISAWDPSCDGLGGPQPKNVPCPVGFSLTRSADMVHCSVFLRSSDVFVGLPYDVMGYALTLDAMAASIDCVPGTLHVTLAHAHYYAPHYKYVHDSLDPLKDWTPDVEPSLPGWSIDMIHGDPDGYVDQVSMLSKKVRHNVWDPEPELVL